MKARSITWLAAAALIAGAASAQDFSEGSEAREWGLFAERKALFTAVVSDPLCELARDCAPDCGGGARQIVLIRQSDGVMVFPLKNAEAAFNGAVADLAPFCGQTVEVDGLILDDPDLGATNVYLVQRIRPEGGDWQRANTWTDDWAARNPDAAGSGPWFRRDPRVLGQIEQEGYLGLGLEADQKFFLEWF